MKRQHLEWFIKILICATFFVPLVVIPSRFIFPFIVPKIVVFRSIVILMLAGYLLLLATHWEAFKTKMSAVTIAVLLFFVSFAVSTFAGVDWYKSFWDNHERMLGLFTILHYVLYYIIVTSVIREWRDWRWLLRLFLFAGEIVVFIALLQEFNRDLLLNQGGSRVSATLGNAIYLGGYGLFLFFISWLLLWKESHRWWRIHGAIGCIFGIAGIFFSGTRGALLGWIAGVVVLSLMYLITLKDHKRVRQGIVAVWSVGIIILVALFSFRHTPFVQRIPAVGGLLNLSLSSGTASTRLIAWGVAIDGWKERPIFGWGPNNYFLTFNKYYHPESLRHGWGETWFDNAHNILLNTLTVQGIMGLLTYLAMFVVSIIILCRWYREKKIDAHIFSIGIAFLIAHLVQNVFVFENPTSYLYFFFFLAFLNQQSAGGAPVIAEESGGQKVSWGLPILVGGVMLLFIYATNINPARANMESLNLLRSLYSQRDPAGQYERTAAIPTPHIDDIRIDFARTLLSVLPAYVESGRKEEAVRLLTLGLEELRKNRILHPDDIRNQLHQAQLGEMGARLLNRVDFFIEGESALEDALQRSPKRQMIYYMLSSMKLALGKPEESIALLQETISHDSTIGEGWWRLALTYKQIGMDEAANATVRDARAAGAKFDDHGLQVLNEILPEAVTDTTP